MRIETENLILSIPSCEDGPQYHQAVIETMDDFKQFPFTWPLFQRTPSLDICNEYCCDAQIKASFFTLIPLKISLKSTNSVVGMIEVHGIDWHNLTWEIGFWTSHSYQKQQIMSEALSGFLNFMKNHYPEITVVIGIEPSNQKAIKLASKVGFKWINTFTNKQRNNTVFEIYYFNSND